MGFFFSSKEIPKKINMFNIRPIGFENSAAMQYKKKEDVRVACGVPLQLHTHRVEDVQGEEVEGIGVDSGLDKRQQSGNDGAHHDHARERGPAKTEWGGGGYIQHKGLLR